MNPTNNDNQQLKNKPMINEVEQYAHELASRFHNLGFFKWYCKVIHDLGIARVRELVGRVEGSDYEARLFSRLAEEELKVLNKNKRLYGDGGR